MSAVLVSLIGPPGVGKTTVAHLLARELAAELILEDYAGNPFLAESYSGSQLARLPGQLYFLVSRVSQLSRLDWPQAGVRVSDYGFCQDAVFAELRLGGDDLRAYRQVLERVAPVVRCPEVVVHLDAAEATLIERIARRGRGFERQSMQMGFLSALRRRYDEVAADLPCPVIKVDCDRTDLTALPALSALADDLRRRIERP